MVIEVWIRQLRYGSPVGMDSYDLSKFIDLMRDFAVDRLGVEVPKISAPKDSSSIKFEFEVGGD